MRPIILAAALMLGACSTQFIATNEPACQSIDIVWTCKSDTISEPTSRRIEANNLAREKMCGQQQRPVNACEKSRPQSKPQLERPTS